MTGALSAEGLRRPNLGRAAHLGTAKTFRLAYGGELPPVSTSPPKWLVISVRERTPSLR
jgi:hypothetical protein